MISRIVRRYGKCDRGACANLAGNVYLASMRFDQLSDDGQAQAGASGQARAGLIGPVKTLEHVRQVLGCDSHSGITDAYLDLRLHSFSRNPYLPASRGVRYSVVQ